jgi:hypothetical protein
MLRRIPPENPRETNHERTPMNTDWIPAKRTTNSVDFQEIRVYSCSFVVLRFLLSVTTCCCGPTAERIGTSICAISHDVSAVMGLRKRTDSH